MNEDNNNLVIMSEIGDKDTISKALLNGLQGQIKIKIFHKGNFRVLKTNEINLIMRAYHRGDTAHIHFEEDRQAFYDDLSARDKLCKTCRVYQVKDPFTQLEMQNNYSGINVGIADCYVRKDFLSSNEIQQQVLMPLPHYQNNTGNIESHPNHASELKLANELWNEIYGDSTKQRLNISVEEQVTRILKKKGREDIQGRTLERIFKLITPDDRKTSKLRSAKIKIMKPPRAYHRGDTAHIHFEEDRQAFYDDLSARDKLCKTCRVYQVKDPFTQLEMQNNYSGINVGIADCYVRKDFLSSNEIQQQVLMPLPHYQNNTGNIESHPNHASELKLANELWNEIYGDSTKQRLNISVEEQVTRILKRKGVKIFKEGLSREFLNL